MGQRCAVLRRPACALSDFVQNQLTGTIPSSLGSLTGLTYLCVRHAVGRHCTVLRRLVCALSWLHSNQLSGTIPSSLGSLTGLLQLCVRHAAGRHCALFQGGAVTATQALFSDLLRVLSVVDLVSGRTILTGEQAGRGGDSLSGYG